jgi:predicted CopG family antitoxin
MKRAQIQLEEDMYDQLRRRAFQEKKSISGVIREMIRKGITLRHASRHLSIKDFKFIAVGRSRQGALKPVSERHDEALGEAFRK